jgi:membrane protease YdiL (CAAX protease family)
VTGVIAAWLALMIGLLAGREIEGGASFVIAAALGAAAVWTGYAAASKCRLLSPATSAERFRRLGWSVVIGITFGLANLGANWAIANHHPTLRALLLRRFAAIDAVSAMVAAPLAEEVVVRLFLMSTIAWIVWRLSDRYTAAFWVALVASSVVFASLHLARPFPGEPELAAFYRGSLMVKYTLAGFPMGWLFWRWGLPYAILCHAVVNGTHLGLERFVFF